MKKNDAILGYTGLRVAMGMAMLTHGAARVGHIPAFVESTVKMFASSVLPAEAVRIFAWSVSPVELLIGVSALLGLATRLGLLFGALWMAILIFGSALIENYSVVGIQLIYAVIFSLLLTNVRYNAVSLDRLFFKNDPQLN